VVSAQLARNIDFEALRGLRDRHGAAFPRGRMICREGDTTAEFYVVLQGSVEVSQRDRITGARRILHTIPAGGFFGEMSCFSGQPRSATCVAAEDSVVLCFNQDTAVQLLRASPQFALGVIQTLCDRVRGANERLGQLETAARLGG
jgi:CRP-like cAMP-binding protein